MYKKILVEVGNFIISPTPYIIALALGGAFFVWHGVLLMFGEGAAALTIGIIMLTSMVALIRSVSRE